MTPKQIKQIYKAFGKISKKYGIEIQVTEMDVVPGRDKFGRPLEYDPNDTSKHAVKSMEHGFWMCKEVWCKSIYWMGNKWFFKLVSKYGLYNGK